MFTFTAALHWVGLGFMVHWFSTKGIFEHSSSKGSKMDYNVKQKCSVGLQKLLVSRHIKCYIQFPQKNKQVPTVFQRFFCKIARNVKKLEKLECGEVTIRYAS